MKKNNMTRTLLLLVIALGMNASALMAQVKIGDNPKTIHADAVLEMESTNQGMLLPRVSLVSTSDFTPLKAHVKGMSVYNIATINDVTPGYYYNDGTKWVKLITATDAEWQDGTVSGTNLIYAKQAKETGSDVVITDEGKVGIGTMNPDEKLYVKGSVKIVDGTQGAGKILVSDANGRARWMEFQSNSYISISLSIDPNVLGYIPSDTATVATNAPAAVSVGTTTATQISSGIFVENGHSYATYVAPSSITWFEAYYAAKAMGGYLATFTTDNEWIYVESNLLTPYNEFNDHACWMGFCKFSWFAGPALTPDPEMKWITGEQPMHDYPSGGISAVRKSNWFNHNTSTGTPEPNNYQSKEGFVHTWPANTAHHLTYNGYTSTHPWNDIPSNHLYVKGFIIEFNQ